MSDKKCDQHPFPSECSPFYSSSAAQISELILTLVSACASVTVIVVILRSQIRLSSVYNRIMLGMCYADLIAFVSLAMLTIPMPSEHIYPSWAGSYGNITTCNIQAFMNVMGHLASGVYIMGLSVFYLCLIRIQMRDKIIRRYVEPTIHICSWLASLSLAVSEYCGIKRKCHLCIEYI